MKPRRFIWTAVHELLGRVVCRETYVYKDTGRQFVFLRDQALLYESVPHFYVLSVLWSALELINREIRAPLFAKRDESLRKLIGL
jgi:hypothetical protein